MSKIPRCSRSYQRLILRCVVAVVLVAAIVYFGGTWPPAADATETRSIRLPRKGLLNTQETLAADKTSRRPDIVLAPSIPVSTDSGSLTVATPTAKPAVALEHELDASFREIEVLFADEYRSKALLSPITKSGQPLLRDLTQRVREFRHLFGLWEGLHLSHSSDGLHQVPLIQRLRKVSPHSAAQNVRSYDKFRHFMNTFAKQLFPWTMLSHPDHMSLHTSFYEGGRGIVFTAGTHQAGLLLTIIPSLRRLRCELPIEVMYLGDEDLDEDMRTELERLDGVVTRDLTLMIDDSGWQLAGWAAKPFAILMSSFREVIFIDADSFFFVDPTTLFDDEGYRSTGALFFKDRNLQPESKRAFIKAVLPSPLSSNVKQNRMWTGESGHMQESGVIVVDKWRHFVPLLLTTRLNGPHRDSKGDEKGIYDMMYGDKETFWLSWEMAGDLDYIFHDGVTGTMGRLTSTYPTDPDTPDETPKPADGPMVCSPQLIHFDRSGKPLWFNGWISATKDNLREWQDFDIHVREPEEFGGKPLKDSWQIFSGNVVCLKAAEVNEFTKQEKSTLAAILELAKAKSEYIEE